MNPEMLEDAVLKKAGKSQPVSKKKKATEAKHKKQQKEPEDKEEDGPSDERSMKSC